MRADLTTTVSLSIDPASPVAEDAGTVTVTLTAATNRALAPEADVEVTVATADGTAMAGEDFESLSETITFAIGDFAAVTGGTHYEASEDVTLTVTDDALDDDDETFSIELSTSAEAGDAPTLGAALTVTITDNDDAPGAPATLTAEGGFEEATLTWTAPADAGTSTIDGYDYRVSTDTTGPFTWDPDWTAIPDSGSGAANATSYTVTMHAGAALENGTTYTFEVRARSAAGAGEGAQGERGAERGLRADPAGSRSNHCRLAGQRMRERDGGTPRGNHQLLFDKQIHHRTEKRGLRGPHRSGRFQSVGERFDRIAEWDFLRPERDNEAEFAEQQARVSTGRSLRRPDRAENVGAGIQQFAWFTSEHIRQLASTGDTGTGEKRPDITASRSLPTYRRAARVDTGR